MSLAEKLMQLRIARKASLQAVADAVNVSKPHIWELEKGKTKNPSLELLTKLAVYYSVSLDFLAGADESSDSPITIQFRNLINRSQISELDNDDMEILKRAIEMAMALITTRRQNSASA